MPKITVVLTTYNLETYINKCLRQLFSQTFQDFNVVIVDDCSNDSTVQKIKPFIEKYNGRIHAYFGDIRTLIPETSGQHIGIIRTAYRKHPDTLSS